MTSIRAPWRVRVPRDGRDGFDALPATDGLPGKDGKDGAVLREVVVREVHAALSAPTSEAGRELVILKRMDFLRDPATDMTYEAHGLYSNGMRVIGDVHRDEFGRMDYVEMRLA